MSQADLHIEKKTTITFSKKIMDERQKRAENDLKWSDDNNTAFFAIPEGFKKNIEVDGDCLIWIGPFTNGNPSQKMNLVYYNILWTIFGNQHKLDDSMTPLTYRLERLCDKENCVRSHHFTFVPRAESDKEYAAMQIKRLENNSILTEDGHLLWQGFIDPRGYGKITCRNGTYSTHSLYWILNHPNETEEEKKLHLLHSPECPHKNCMMLTCLRRGTAKENAADKDVAGTQLRGEKHPSSSLDEKTAKEIYALKDVLKTKEERVVAAAKYKTTVTNLTSIMRGVRWASVNCPEKIEQNRERRHETSENIKSNPATRQDYEDAMRRIEEHSIEKENGCIETDYYCQEGGYPMIHFHGATKAVHVVIAEMYLNNCQPIPNGLEVRHAVCRNHKCRKQEHLAIGTPSQNSTDNYTPEQIDLAKRIYASKEKGTTKERANMFGVPKYKIRRIDAGMNFSSVTGATKYVPPLKRKHNENNM